MTSPTTWTPSVIALGGEVARPRRSRRAEEKRREPVDDDAVELLGHRPVERAQARLDVGDRHAELRGRERAGERRVRVAVDEHPVRLLLEHGALDPGQHARGLLGVRARSRASSRYAGGASPSSSKKTSESSRIVVLAGVQHDLLDARLAKGDARAART